MSADAKDWLIYLGILFAIFVVMTLVHSVLAGICTAVFVGVMTTPVVAALKI